jgi:hypothetical protein
MNDDKKILLMSLLLLDRPLIEIHAAVSKLSWDSDEELCVFTRAHAERALERVIRGELILSDMEEWANLIEGREDIGFEEGREQILREFVHELANPTLTEQLTASRAVEWLERLRTNSS